MTGELSPTHEPSFPATPVNTGTQAEGAAVSSSSTTATTHLEAAPTEDISSVPTTEAPRPPRRYRPWWPQWRWRRWARPARRLVGLDAARGLALAGMMASHAAMRTPDQKGLAPAWLSFANGHSSILFATVAGVSLAIITGRKGATAQADWLRVIARAFGLYVVGSFVAMFGTNVAIILGSYALWFVLALPFLRCRIRVLLIWAAIFLSTGWLVNWVWLNGSLWVGLYPATAPGHTFFELLFSYTYPASIWLGFVLIGLALGRAGLRNPRVLTRWGLTGLAVFVGCAAPFVIQEGSLDPVLGTAHSPQEIADSETLCMSNGKVYPCPLAEFDTIATQWSEADWQEYQRLKGSSPVDESSFVFSNLLRDQWTLAPHSGSPFEVFSSAGFAVAVICGFIALGRRARYLLIPFAAMGSMVLTAYTSHLWALWLWEYVFLSRSSNLPYLTMLSVIAAACFVWSRLFERGPLEQAMAAFADWVATRPSFPPPERGIRADT